VPQGWVVGFREGVGKGIYAVKAPAAHMPGATRPGRGKGGDRASHRGCPERRSRGEGGERRDETRAKGRHEHLNAVLQSSVKCGPALSVIK